MSVARTTATPPDEPLRGETRRPRVAVLFGGRSGEHGISCVTAAGVLEAIDRSRYDVVPIGITRSGRWLVVADEPDAWRLRGGELPEVTEAAAALPGAVLTSTDRTAAGLVTVPGTLATREAGTADAARAVGAVDVVLPLLHGPYGEDGTVQGLLELAGVRYAGAGVLASAAAMDKHTMKVLLRAAGLAVTDWVLLRPEQWRADLAGVAGLLAPLGSPVFVKPSRAGSSIGITRLADPRDRPALLAALEAAAEHDPRVIVESAAAGREIECGVLGVLPGASGNGAAPAPAAEASPCGEIVVTDDRDFYDFEAKYLDDAAVRLDCPAALPEPVAAEVRRQSVAAFEALGCEGLARVDFFVDVAEGPGGPRAQYVVNEVNTMPGFTPTSMFPRLWAAAGLEYPALVDRLLQLALARPAGLR